MSDRVSERMGWLVKPFEFGGQHRDTYIRLSAREVWLKCIQLISSFRQSLAACSAVIGWLAVNGPNSSAAIIFLGAPFFTKPAIDHDGFKPDQQENSPGSYSPASPCKYGEML